MNDHTRCPSSNCQPGAVLLGIVLPGGRVAFAANKIVVDEEFVRVAHEQLRPPEQRFRFSHSCVRSGCRQWDDDLDGPGAGGCSLIDRLMDHVEAEGTMPSADEAPVDCPIRDECRWFKQRGGAACMVCPIVVTDMTTRDEDLPSRVVKVREAMRSSAASS